MGQTLTHGVYLPNEGERNCYSGLAANWRLLDGAIGTVAAHTTAIAGKADISHSHGNISNDGKVGTDANKPLITGTGGAVQAGSFGNAANTFCEGNDSRLSDARTPVAHTHTKSDVTDLFNSANTWSGDQTVTASYYVKSTTWEKGVEPASSSHKNIYFIDNNNLSVGTIRRRIANGSQSFQFFGSAFVKNGQLDPTGDNVNWGFSQVFLSNGSTYFQFDGNIGNSIIPKSNNTYDLGSSTNKWKTINGINPGGLSLPGTGGYTDIKGDITNLSGGNNTFTAPYDGWVCIKSTNATAIHIINTTWAVSQSATQSTAGTLCCLCPVMSNQSFNVIANATSLEYAYIHPCRGNV